MKHAPYSLLPCLPFSPFDGDSALLLSSLSFLLLSVFLLEREGVSEVLAP